MSFSKFAALKSVYSVFVNLNFSLRKTFRLLNNSRFVLQSTTASFSFLSKKDTALPWLRSIRHLVLTSGYSHLIPAIKQHIKMPIHLPPLPLKLPPVILQSAVVFYRPVSCVAILVRVTEASSSPHLCRLDHYPLNSECLCLLSSLLRSKTLSHKKKL